MALHPAFLKAPRPFWISSSHSTDDTIREGHRVKVYISQDLLLPAYENHTIPSTL